MIPGDLIHEIQQRQIKLPSCDIYICNIYIIKCLAVFSRGEIKPSPNLVDHCPRSVQHDDDDDDVRDDKIALPIPCGGSDGRP